jgi:ketosteroid isomerase-like protein
MAQSPVEVVARIATVFQRDDLAAVVNDPEEWSSAMSPFRDLIGSDFAGAMVGPRYAGGRIEFRGVDELREAWMEWLGPFETYSADLEGIHEAGENIVTLVRQRGRTRTGGVEVEEPAAAVWTIRGGKLARVEFHLEREAAMKAAGIAAPEGS